MNRLQVTKRFLLTAALVCCAGLALAATEVAGLQSGELAQRKKGKEKEWKPAFVPAEAMKFGARLEELASPAVKDWMGSYMAHTMRNAPVNPRAAMAGVDERYPQASEIARDAGAFLLQYLAYKDEDENQRVLAGQIREIDRETYEISRQINIVYENEQRRLGSTHPVGAITAQQRVQLDEEVRKMEEQLRQFGTERQLKSTALDASRKKINLYLKALGIVYERMKDVPAESIRELK